MGSACRCRVRWRWRWRARCWWLPTWPPGRRRPRWRRGRRATGCRRAPALRRAMRARAVESGHALGGALVERLAAAVLEQVLDGPVVDGALLDAGDRDARVLLGVVGHVEPARGGEQLVGASLLLRHGMNYPMPAARMRPGFPWFWPFRPGFLCPDGWSRLIAGVLSASIPLVSAAHSCGSTLLCIHNNYGRSASIRVFSDPASIRVSGEPVL